MDCKWLPDLIIYDGYNSWADYEAELYRIFCNDFKNSHPIFEGKKVQIRYYPIEYGKEEAFFHVTCQDYLKNQQRVPDLRRCERIKWVRKFIENYKCSLEECSSCDGLKVWKKPYQNTHRIHILFEEERYMVVLEQRNSYCLLITAFYLDEDHRLRKKLSEYEKYKAKNASSK